MVNEAALTTPGRDSHISGVTLGSYQVRGGIGHEVNMNRQG